MHILSISLPLAVRAYSPRCGFGDNERSCLRRDGPVPVSCPAPWRILRLSSCRTPVCQLHAEIDRHTVLMGISRAARKEGCLVEVDWFFFFFFLFLIGLSRPVLSCSGFCKAPLYTHTHTHWNPPNLSHWSSNPGSTHLFIVITYLFVIRDMRTSVLMACTAHSYCIHRHPQRWVDGWMCGVSRVGRTFECRMEPPSILLQQWHWHWQHI